MPDLRMRMTGSQRNLPFNFRRERSKKSDDLGIRDAEDSFLLARHAKTIDQ
ncbi:hypothetical protein [Acidithiobacillus ferrooxidans]|jgi:hypothetical protein|uniref:hypothetical protein n=1 Tax=Acidithiobacillus ferrooxidans TaxID=920 RepID=UPI002148D74B|nr:hypothetical protein [Acidithiobacillus ferrooxidans]